MDTIKNEAQDEPVEDAKAKMTLTELFESTNKGNESLLELGGKGMVIMLKSHENGKTINIRVVDDYENSTLFQLSIMKVLKDNLFALAPSLKSLVDFVVESTDHDLLFEKASVVRQQMYSDEDDDCEACSEDSD